MTASHPTRGVGAPGNAPLRSVIQCSRLTLGQHNPEAHAVVPEVRQVAEAGRGPAVPGVVEPVAAAKHAVRDKTKSKQIENVMETRNPIFTLSHPRAKHTSLSRPLDGRLIVILVKLHLTGNCLVVEPWDVNIVPGQIHVRPGGANRWGGLLQVTRNFRPCACEAGLFE